MYSYRIISDRSKTPLKPAHSRSKQETREATLQKQLRNLKFAVGNEVRIKGTSIHGIIREIIRDPERIVWKSNSPCYIVVESLRGDVAALYHPSKLKRIGTMYQQAKREGR